MNETLYIIGNGFDLYHGLNTRYQAFAFYLQDYHNEIHEYLVTYYGLSDLNREIKEDHWNLLWADFEKALANLDFQSVLDDNKDYLPNTADPDFKSRDWHSYEIEIEGIVKKITTDLFKAFKDFILNVTFPDSIDNKRLQLKKEALYLTFNYTDTLECYYSISTKTIFHIHGKAKTEDSILILGHGSHPDKFKIEEPKPPEGITEEEYELWYEEMGDKYDYSYTSGQEEVMTYFSKSFKSTEKIIEERKGFFDHLKGIREIFIIGHSLSEVDIPYFEKIIQSVNSPNTIWTVSYYGDKEKEPLKKILLSLGLKENQIHLVEMDYFKK